MAAPETREERGQRLFEEKGEEIKQRRDGRWIVPSESGKAVYTVRGDYCSCPDRQKRESEEPCKHIIAIGILKRKTFRCDSCHRRRPRTERHEVMEDGTVSFEGEQLCDTCVEITGAEVA